MVLFACFSGRHIIVAGKTEVFETWECDWMCEFRELQEDPTTAGQKLILKVPVRQLRLKCNQGDQLVCNDSCPDLIV